MQLRQRSNGCALITACIDALGRVALACLIPFFWNAISFQPKVLTTFLAVQHVH